LLIDWLIFLVFQNEQRNSDFYSKTMASLRNAMPRREHKERAQPAARKHLGILEKKKDYVERARDFQKKVKHINDLKEKTLERNPDEFYYGMIKSKTKDGIHEAQRTDGTDTMSHAEIRLLKDQDMTYIGMKQIMDVRKAERLQKDLHLLLEKPINKHKIFFENEKDAAKFDPVEHFDTIPQVAKRAYNRPRKSVLLGEESSESDPSATTTSIGGIISAPSNMNKVKKAMKQREKAYTELSQRIERSEKLKRVIQYKQVEKNVMGKGKKMKVKDAANGAPAVYKWKRVRAR
jgi:U3 small nucleolar RNA-associated protein 11